MRKTKDIFLVYGGSDLKLEGYFNSSFQLDPDDNKFISGYVFILNNRVVS